MIDPLFDVFLGQFYNHGATKVPNLSPNPEDVTATPLITFNYAYHEYSEFRDKVSREFEQWKAQNQQPQQEYDYGGVEKKKRVAALFNNDNFKEYQPLFERTYDRYKSTLVPKLEKSFQMPLEKIKDLFKKNTYSNEFIERHTQVSGNLLDPKRKYLSYRHDPRINKSDTYWKTDEDNEAIRNEIDYEYFDQSVQGKDFLYKNFRNRASSLQFMFKLYSGVINNAIMDDEKILDDPDYKSSLYDAESWYDGPGRFSGLALQATANYFGVQGSHHGTKPDYDYSPGVTKWLEENIDDYANALSTSDDVRDINKYTKISSWGDDDQLPIPFENLVAKANQIGSYNEDCHRKFIKTYALSQAIFDILDIKSLPLFRGVSKQVTEDLNVGDAFSMPARQVSSYTPEWRVAHSFAREIMQNGAIAVVDVPVENIFWNPATHRTFGAHTHRYDEDSKFSVMYESEVLVLGAQNLTNYLTFKDPKDATK